MFKFLSLILVLFLSFACSKEEAQVNTSESEAHYRLGIEFAQYSLFENSIDEFDLALKYDPSNIKAYNKKGLVLFGIKEYGKALEMFQKVISLQPDHLQAHINMGMVSYMEGNKDGAVRIWEKAIAIKEGDNDSKAINNIANVYKEKGDYAKAVEYYTKAIDID